jgi:hypothetical protein
MTRKTVKGEIDRLLTFYDQNKGGAAQIPSVAVVASVETLNKFAERKNEGEQVWRYRGYKLVRVNSTP